MLKVYRRVEEGINPDVEIGQYLTHNTSFRNSAPVLGTIEYRGSHDAEPMTLALLQGYIGNNADAYQFTQQALTGSFKAAACGGHTAKRIGKVGHGETNCKTPGAGRPGRNKGPTREGGVRSRDALSFLLAFRKAVV